MLSILSSEVFKWGLIVSLLFGLGMLWSKVLKLDAELAIEREKNDALVEYARERENSQKKALEGLGILKNETDPIKAFNLLNNRLFD